MSIYQNCRKIDGSKKILHAMHWFRHRALTGVTGVDNTDIERCSQDRLSESDTWKKAFGYLDSDASSLSSYEDVVSVETVLSDLIMESNKRSVHTAIVDVMIVIPDMICLCKSKRGFFGKKKLWLNKVRWLLFIPPAEMIHIHISMLFEQRE